MGVEIEVWSSGVGMNECVFCEIVSGDAEASIAYADELVIVFLTIAPVTPGHLMVVPKPHLPYLADIDEETGARMFSVAQRMAEAFRSSALRCEGVNLFYADGEAAFQEVFHAHLHVFARFEGDGFRLDANWDVRPSRAELDHNAFLLREALS